MMIAIMMIKIIMLYYINRDDVFVVIVKGWHNSAALSYLNPSASHPNPNPNPNENQNPNQFSGYNLSYGFAPNIIASHIPNPNRENIPSHPIGWAVGGNISAFSNPPTPHVPEPIQSQVEIPCQAIRVSEDDMPNFLFKFPTVRKQ